MPPELSEIVLAPVIRSLLGDDARLRDWTAEPIRYDIRSPISAGMYLVRGRATWHGLRQEWSAVLKILQETGDADLRSYGYWLREIQAYENGPLPAADLAVPTLLAVQSPTSTTRWPWLAYVRGTGAVDWCPADFIAAGRRLGKFQGQYLSRNAIPDREWWCMPFVSTVVRRNIARQNSPHCLAIGASYAGPVSSPTTYRSWPWRPRLIPINGSNSFVTPPRP
jgi:hypothetical protein